MPSRLSLSLKRTLLLLIVLFTVGAGLLLPEHLHKIIASVCGGVLTGVLVFSALIQISKSDQSLWRDINKNTEEAQQILEQYKASRWWGYGTQNYSHISSPTQHFTEMLEHPMVVLLLIAIAAMVWMSPTFAYSVSIYEAPYPYLMKAVGMHLLALFFIGGAVMGIGLRLQRGYRGAP